MAFKIIKALFYTISLSYIFMWIILQSTIEDKTNSPTLALFSDTYGIIALLASFIGVFVARHFSQSKIGRIIGAFSLGVFLQFLGQIFYAYYRIVLQIEGPYPSVGDIFYFSTIPLYIYAGWTLVTLFGENKLFSSIKNTSIVIGTIIFMVSLDYFLFLKDYDASNYTKLQIFLDYGYPILQAVFVALAISAYLMLNKIGGYLKRPVVLLIIALYTQYLADTIFTYKTINETAYSGDIFDLLYIVSYFLIGLSFIGFNEVYNKIKQNGGN